MLAGSKRVLYPGGPRSEYVYVLDAVFYRVAASEWYFWGNARTDVKSVYLQCSIENTV